MNAPPPRDGTARTHGLGYVEWRRGCKALERLARHIALAVVVAAALPVCGALALAARGAAAGRLGPTLALMLLLAASLLAVAWGGIAVWTRALVPPESQATWEHRLASEIQTSILPRQIDIEGIEIAACMVPAELVGGDYFDVIPVPDGCWIGIGDVAGHGLDAGLIMFMVQGMVQGLVRVDPEARPCEIVAAVNRAVYELVRVRQGREEHVTFCLMHYRADGRLVFAGGHEDILIRRKVGATEQIAALGAWLGAVRDISRTTPDTEAQLEPGDLMLLHTDGITEARGDDGAQFGLAGLCRVLDGAEDLPAATVRDRILAATDTLAHARDDDRSLVAVRCQGVYWTG